MKYLITILFVCCAVCAETEAEKTSVESQVMAVLQAAPNTKGAKIGTNIVFTVSAWRRDNVTGTNIWISYVDAQGNTNRWRKGQ